jgi:hypothetical protein
MLRRLYDEATPREKGNDMTSTVLADIRAAAFAKLAAAYSSEARAQRYKGRASDVARHIARAQSATLDALAAYTAARDADAATPGAV